MEPCIFGTETELGLVVGSEDAIRPAPRELAPSIVDDMAKRYVHLPSPPPERRLFLENGACVYADIGGHPEMATAECSNPIDLVAQNLALRQMLAESARSVGCAYGIPISLICNNLDYAFSGAQTYGYHLNVLLTRVTLQRAVAQLSPLFAAMPVIAGTGKASFSTGSGGFELSQRAQFMTAVAGKHTTSNRAMVTIKDEALTNTGVRLHLICFDTPKSVYQLALVPAVIAMTSKVIDSESDIAGPMTLEDPIQALHAISRDPSLNVKVPLKNRDATTALDIHDHYIKSVGEFIARTDTPPWFSQMLELWQEMIENLRENLFSEIHRLDWVAKLVIFTKMLERVQLTWMEYSKWMYVLSWVRQQKSKWPDLNISNLTESYLSQAGIPRSAFGVLDQYLAMNDLSWKDFPRIWHGANQLCHQCLRYHTLDPEAKQGFDQDSGIAPLVTRELVDKARTSPPAGTRAAIRAKAIKNAHADTTADWTAVKEKGRFLDMSDAFGKNASWKKIRAVKKTNEVSRSSQRP